MTWIEYHKNYKDGCRESSESIFFFLVVGEKRLSFSHGLIPKESLVVGGSVELGRTDR